MKNDNEMYQSLLSRYDEYQEKKKKRFIAIRRTVPVIASLCLTLGLGLGYQKYYSKIPMTPMESDIVNEAAETTSAAYTTSKSSATQAAVTENIPTTAVTSKAEQAAATVTQAEKNDITEPNSGENTVQTKSTKIAAQAPATSVIAAETQPPIVQIKTEPPPQTTLPIPPTEPPTVTTISPAVHEVKFGYIDVNDNTGHHSPSAPQNIVMKCLSFCEADNTLTVDVAMGDASVSPLNESTGNYKYEIYAIDGLFHRLNDERLIVNGSVGGYLKEYSSDDARIFDIDKKIGNYDAYHRETAEVDLRKYQTGSSGCIAFSFLIQHETSTMGSIERLYFYVGEHGTGISNISVEDAKENYTAVKGDDTEQEQSP